MPANTPNWRAYQNALLSNIYSDDQKELERRKLASRVGSFGQLLVNQFLPKATIPVAQGAMSTVPGAVASNVGATTASTAGMSTTASAASPVAGALTGTTSTAATAGTEAGAAGAGTTAGAEAGGTAAAGGGAAEGASSSLDSTGVGAIIGAGLAVGGATPGSSLFPAKQLGYNLLHAGYQAHGGTIMEKATGGTKGWGPEAMVNRIWGDPNVQAEQAQARGRSIALSNMFGTLDKQKRNLMGQDPVPEEP